MVTFSSSENESEKDLTNKNINVLNYYCVKHHYESKIIKDSKKCNSKIQYRKKEDDFYLIIDHSNECELDKELPKEKSKKNQKIFIKYLI